MMPPAVSSSAVEWTSQPAPALIQQSQQQQFYYLPQDYDNITQVQHTQVQAPPLADYMHQSAHHVLLSSAAIPALDATMPFDDGLTSGSIYSPLSSVTCSSILDKDKFDEYPYFSSRSVLDAVDDDMSSNLWSSVANKRFTVDVPQLWATKPLRMWSEQDVSEWLHKDLNVPPENFKTLRLTGDQLAMLDQQCLESLERELQVDLQGPLKEILEVVERPPSGNQLTDIGASAGALHSYDTSYINTDLVNRLRVVKEESESSEYHHWAHPDYSPTTKKEQDSTDSEDGEEEKEVIAVRGRPSRRGRPPNVTNKNARRKLEKRNGRLWEFIRDLLKNPAYCPSLICWENHDEGVFRFVSSEKVAQLWGSKRGNTKMTYEKLSRAMRYYYKSKILQPVTHRRLVYRFGPNATNWRHPNPNFRTPV